MIDEILFLMTLLTPLILCSNQNILTLIVVKYNSNKKI